VACDSGFLAVAGVEGTCYTEGRAIDDVVTTNDLAGCRGFACKHWTEDKFKRHSSFGVKFQVGWAGGSIFGGEAGGLKRLGGAVLVTIRLHTV
jgi:hypothetical protein